MPRGDGTGPQGMGSMTGRGPGIGFARGLGFRNACFDFGGRGYRCRYYTRNVPARNNPGIYSKFSQFAGVDCEKQALENHANILQSELDFINARLAELTNPSSKE